MLLSPKVASGVGADQFLKQIRETNQLETPHVLILLDLGEAAVCDSLEDLGFASSEISIFLTSITLSLSSS